MHCYGCGQKLQSDDENLSGYVPEKVLNNKEDVLCQRCFRLQHYNTNSEVEMVDDDYEKILAKITKEDALIVYILDIFNFEASLIKNLKKYINNKDLIVLINKRDIIPSSVKDEKILSWVKKRLKKEGLNNIKETIISSGITNYNIDLILEKISEFRNERNVYIIGNSNVGKSTFINSLLKNYSNETSHLITTSTFPGTTLNVIEIPLDQKSYIYDSPGLIAKDLMWNVVEPKNLKLLLPKKEIKPINFQIKPKQSIIIGGLAIVDFIENDNNEATFYFSTFVNLHRCKTEKCKNTFNNLIKGNAIRPTSPFIKKYDDLNTQEVTIDNKQKMDIVIRGYGWISLIGPATLELHLPSNVKISIREALI